MDWRYNTIWFEQLAEGQMAAVNFSRPLKDQPDTSHASYLLASSFKSKRSDFTDFPAPSSLLYLHLILGNATSFKGIHQFSNLKRLELTHCYKLQSDDGLEELAGSLEWLHINQSRKISFGDNLLKLANLKVLCLNDCAPIPSLAFLSNFPRLVDFRFVNTSIEDGDLEPLLKHPTLCSVGFLDKRHYNLKSSLIKEVFRDKRTPAIVPAHKGPYETYRYSALGA